MEKINWNIPDLLQLSGGYWSACALHSGVRLDVFTLLSGSPSSAAEVAAACKSDERGMETLLNALSALGLLDKNQGSYIATRFAADYLSQNSPTYMGHIIMHHHHLMSGWARLHESVKSGSPVRGSVASADDAGVRESFLMGMFNLASQLAPRIVREIDLSGCRTLLDLGGGPGTYAVHFCLQNPELTAVVFDLPTTRSFAEGVVGRFHLSGRVSFTGGDYNSDNLPTGFDAVWISHILHGEGPERCAGLLSKAVSALRQGGVLMVQEFILDDDKDGPQFPALFSLNMLLGTEAGRSYSGRELAELMGAAGLADVRRLPIELPNGAGIMEGRKTAA